MLLQFFRNNNQNPLEIQSKIDLSQFSTLFNTLLYGSPNYKSVIQKLNSSFKGMGVCAKPLKQGDVAWKCEDCEKDKTCIICQECFQKGDHKGHRVWLKTNVGGCCDCGDPDGWDEKGFCSDHKGFEASSESMLHSLPDYIKDSAPHCFAQLCRQLKQTLLNLQNDEKSLKLKALAAEIFNLMIDCCSDIPSNIYFLSKGLTQIFYGDHQKHKGHLCNYRYFTTPEEKNSFEELYQKFDTKTKDLCSCSTLDLIFQTNFMLNSKTQQSVQQLFIKLFQTYEFKLHLSLAYTVNYHVISKWPTNNQDTSYQHLGVQILTIESITQFIMRDPNLRINFISALRYHISEFLLDHNNEIKRYQILTCLTDLKYMAKPEVLPFIIGQTDFLEELIKSLDQFHFIDCSKRPIEMQEFENDARQIISYVTIEIEITAKIQIYLEQVKQQEDIQRLMNFFERILQNLAEKQLKHDQECFYSMPIVRIFSYFVQRLQLREIVEGTQYQISENIKNCLIPLLGVQNGFIAELKSKLWIYKGELYQSLANIYTSLFKEYFLSDLGLLQCLIYKFPDQTLDQYLQKFGTSSTLAPLFISMANVSFNDEMYSESPFEAFQQLVQPWIQKIDPEKLGLLIQNVLTRVVQICIFESGITANIKNLFSQDSSSQAQFYAIFSKQIQREVFHVLFMLGTSTTIDKIKKQTNQIYQHNSEAFMNALLSLTTSSADQQGKITFRLKEEFLPIFDPYYYVIEKHQNLQNAAYQYYRQNLKLNNQVGDYRQNYSYSTNINKTVWSALCRSQIINLIVIVVREFLVESEPVKLKIINQQAFNAALKLLTLIIQNLEQQDQKFDFLRKYLPRQILVGYVKGTSQEEIKLKQILVFVAQKLFGDVDEEMNSQDNIQQTSQNQQSKISNAELIKKKKLETIAKMKAKQQDFLTKISQDQSKPDKNVEESKSEAETKKNELTCASCQEPLSLQTYHERMYVQMGFISRSKLLYRSYQQTSRQQVKPFSTYKGDFKLVYAGENFETSLENLVKDEANEVSEFGLNEVVDIDTKCGTQLNRCCHYFHADCLAQYRTAEANRSFQQAYSRQLVGFDDDMIQCIICQTLSNTQQPILPANKDTKNLEVHLQFISDLITKQQQKPKDILFVDLKKDPEDFMQKLMQFTVHSILTLTTYKYANMLQLHDSTTTSSNITLRDLVYILRSSSELINRSQQDDDAFTLKQLGANLLVLTSDYNLTENPFRRNHAKLIVQLIFCVSFMPDNLSLLQICLQSVYSVFLAQVAVSYLFKKESGVAAYKDLYEEWPTKIKALFQNNTDQEQNEELMEMQLTFLRAAACIKLVAITFSKVEENQEQLGLPLNIIQELRQLQDNVSEFKYLVSYLDLNYDLVYEEPQSLKQLLESQDVELQNLYYSIQSATSLQSDMVTQLILLSQPKPADKQNKQHSDPFYQQSQSESVVIHKSMTVLTPFFTFQFVDLPSDYQTLVKECYQKQCRNCKKQLQNNAICLICGEVVCLIPKDQCCKNLPGILTNNTLNVSQNNLQLQTIEGELSYHARHWEGGATAFIVPNTAEIYLFDNGRICEFESFYRNRLGEVFSAQSTKKWENFFRNEETGGTKIQEILRRIVIQGELPNHIIQKRLKGSKVLRRNVY